MEKVALLVLGKRLNKDGTPTDMLYLRLDAAVKPTCETGTLFHPVKPPNTSNLLFNRMKEEKKDVWVVVTGGKVEKGRDNKNPTEAEVMQKYMSKLGVPAARIVLEKNSLTTVHNMQNSAEILRRHRFSKVYLVTTDFHLGRSMFLFKNLVPAFADKVEGFGTENGLSEEEHNKEINVEIQMMERYKTRFPNFKFEI